jgi:ATP phosphoribosyltransferase regulatory subunit HisZ
VNKRAAARTKTGESTVPSSAAAGEARAPAEIQARPATKVLYDLICPIEGRLESGLTFEACQQLAREHNREHNRLAGGGRIDRHDADCIRRRIPSS